MTVLIYLFHVTCSSKWIPSNFVWDTLSRVLLASVTFRFFSGSWCSVLICFVEKSIHLVLITFVVKLFSFAYWSRLFKEDLVPITASSRSLGFADTSVVGSFADWRASEFNVSYKSLLYKLKIMDQVSVA